MIRVALYWTPPQDDPLATAGHAWLGRDAEHGAPVMQPAVPGIVEATAAPRLYGFHATLRPPMQLATGWDEFLGAAEALAGRTAAFDLPPLRVQDIGSFLTLQTALPCPALHALADACVTATDPHRRRAGDAELAQRRAAGLTAEQDALLLRWGYPYVLKHWWFHMTLTGRMQAPDLDRLRAAADTHFAPALSLPRRVTDLAVFTQRGPGAPFLVAERLRLAE